MKQSTKAALLSALLFPGLGQLIVQKRTARACLFLIPAVCALLFLLGAAITAANMIVDGIVAGTIPLDPAIIMQQIEGTDKSGNGNIAGLVLIVAWLASIVDALLSRP